MINSSSTASGRHGPPSGNSSSSRPVAAQQQSSRSLPPRPPRGPIPERQVQQLTRDILLFMSSLAGTTGGTQGPGPLLQRSPAGPLPAPAPSHSGPIPRATGVQEAAGERLDAVPEQEQEEGELPVPVLLEGPALPAAGWQHVTVRAASGERLQGAAAEDAMAELLAAASPNPADSFAVMEIYSELRVMSQARGEAQEWPWPRDGSARNGG